MRLRIKNTEYTLKVLGWVQIFGGIYGIGFVSWLTINVGDINGALLFILLFGYSLNIFCITSGIKLLNQDSIKYGLMFSMINYAFQVIQFKILGYSLIFSSGTAFTIGFNDGFRFNFALFASSFQMAINTDDTDFVFMLNFVAILILVVLEEIWSEKYGKKKTEKLEQIVEKHIITENNSEELL